MRVQIVHIDRDGYNGRDYFPLDSDLGEIVTVLKAELLYIDGSGGVDEPVLAEDGRLVDDAVNVIAGERHPDRGVYTVFECVTRDRRRVTLIQHEVSILGSGAQFGEAAAPRT